MKKRYSKDWSKIDILHSFTKLAIMLLRGLPFYFLFNRVGGLIFIGKGVKIRNAKYIRTRGIIVIEDYTEIQGLSKNGLTFGKNVTIGRNTMIRPSSYYGGEIGEGLVIGDNSNIGPKSYIGCFGFLRIGNNVMCAPGLSTFPENHNFSCTEANIKDQGVSKGLIEINDNCWIASNVTILNNVNVGEGSIIAAGSVVTKNIVSNTIVGGVPAKQIKVRE